jgi:transcriptional regulator with XRE-family HTH domain
MLKIKELCKSKRISMAELANKIGVTPSALSQNISGNPSLDRLKEIADALNVPITELFEQPASDTITCPKCGAKLEIKAKE